MINLESNDSQKENHGHEMKQSRFTNKKIAQSRSRWGKKSRFTVDIKAFSRITNTKSRITKNPLPPSELNNHVLKGI